MKHSQKPNQWRAFMSIAYYSLKAQTRNPATFFFGFIFPIVFISIFGLIGNGQQQITIGLPESSDTNNPIVSILQEQEYLSWEIADTSTLQELLRKGDIAGIVEIHKTSEEQYSVELITSSGLPQQSGIVRSVVSHIIDQQNLAISGITTPPITFTQHTLEGREPRYIDFAVPGQIGFALLSTAIFGTVFGLIYLKKTLILKRLFATPVQPLTILLGQGASRLIIALAQTVLILVVAVVAFHFYLPNGFITFIELIVLSALGLIAFLGFGYFIAGLSNDENAASPLSNLITLPQFLLSGTFFPTDSLPGWLQPIANNLPLSYFNTAIRTVTTDGGNIIETWPYMVGLLGWGACMYILAARTFKWQ